MNERIRELAEQAGYVPLEPRTFADDLQDIFLKKFAELIVKECMDQVRDEVQYITDYDKADQVVNVVKKHFGVEE